MLRSAFGFRLPWRRLLSLARASHRAVPRTRGRGPLRLEALEDRWAPSIDLVTNLSGSPSVAGSLPYEVAHAADGDTIQFAPSLYGGDLRLNQPLVLTNNNLLIDGFGANITIDGSNTAQVFDIRGASNVTLDYLTITGGVTSSSGGGILVESGSSVALLNSTVTGCSASRSGGGIFNGGTLSMFADTLSRNTAFDSTIPSGDGGGIANQGVLSMTNCTVGFNTAFLGGGIHNEGTLSLTNCTVAGNALQGSGADGGGIENSSGTLDLLNTIVDNPAAGLAAHPDVDGSIDQAQACLFSHDVSGQIVTDRGGNQEGHSPLLGPLQNNGGPTATFALLANSAFGIGQGASSSQISGLIVPHLDQRGYERPSNSVDIGAVQTQTGVVADFGSQGVQQYTPSGWQPLSPFSAQSVAVDGEGNVVAAFAGSGLWRHTLNGTWTQIDTFTPQRIAVSPYGEVTASFANGGLWTWSAGTWTQIDTFTPQSFAVDATGHVVASFTNGGVWRRDINGTWTQIDTFTPQSFAVDGNGDVAAVFAGNGLWRWTPAGVWTQIDGFTPQSVTMDAGGDVFASFAGGGLWRWAVATGSWTQIDTFTPQLISADADGDVVAAFADGSLWRWLMGSGWTELKATAADAIGASQF